MSLLDELGAPETGCWRIRNLNDGVKTLRHLFYGAQAIVSGAPGVILFTNPRLKVHSGNWKDRFEV